MNTEEIVIRPKFWPPYWDGNRPELTSKQLGWNEIKRREAGSDDTKDIYDYYVDFLAMDLSLYYVDNNKFYYIDVMNREVVQQREKADWNGEYDYDRVEVYECEGDDSADSFDFDSAEQVWNEFKIDGKPLSYILEHSVIWISS